MKSNLQIGADLEAKVSGPSFHDRGRTYWKRAWLTGIFILWAIIFFAVQWLCSPQSYTAIARIEILGSRDRFDPQIWFQDKLPVIAAPNVNELAEAYKSSDLAQSVVAALRPQEIDELALALAEKKFKPDRILSRVMALLPYNNDAMGNILGSTASNTSSVKIQDLIQNRKEPVPHNGSLSAAANYVGNNLSVKPVESCNMLDISISAPTQSLATELLNQYLKRFSARNLDKRRIQTIDSADSLKEGVKETRGQVKEAEASLLDFIIENGFCATKESGLGQVFRVINRRLGNRMSSGQSYQEVINLDGDHHIYTSQEPPDQKDTVQALSMDLEKLKAEQSGLGETLGSNHPRMIALTARISFLRNRIDLLRRRSSPDIPTEPKEVVTNSNDIPASHKACLAKAKSLEEQYSDLRRDLDYKDEFHRLVRREAQDWDIRTKTISNNIVVIDGPRAGKRGWW